MRSEISICYSSSDLRFRLMAFYDPLTTSPNRFLLQDCIRQAVILAYRSEKKAGITFLNRDHFKEINDRYDSSDHQAYEDALEAVSREGERP